ncbi:expansin (peptidoglycan-binding protein) [Bradyrhizobium sp. LB9.1b]
MTAHYDALETREQAAREADLFSRLPGVLRSAMTAPAYADRLKGVDPATVTSRTALAGLPVLRKSELPALHKASTPFGGFVAAAPGSFARLFTSPGPIFSSRRDDRPTPGAAHGRYSRPGSGPMTSCSTPSATISPPAASSSMRRRARSAAP